MKNNIYFTLDEAREEIKKRWSDETLKKKVEEYLSNNFIPGIQKNEPRAVFIRTIISPDNGYDFFFLNANYLGLKPLYSEYTDDLFVGLSEEKLGLARLHLIWEDGKKKLVDIVDFKNYHGKQIPDVKVVTGENLVDFHHNLLKFSQYPIGEITNVSKYFKSYGKPKDYYPYYLANFICHGVLFENFETDPSTHEYKFTNDVALSVIDLLEKQFGVKPIIVKLYPDNQTEEEDFFWWCYNSSINNFLINYVKKNNCIIKKSE
ncbi:MAG: hypothetical protein KA515_00990 [Candidatus Pacebacteria bacterium]|nr:hypothetical protein [Candidatus Paceibacterota bacterium]